MRPEKDSREERRLMRDKKKLQSQSKEKRCSSKAQLGRPPLLIDPDVYLENKIELEIINGFHILFMRQFLKPLELNSLCEVVPGSWDWKAEAALLKQRIGSLEVSQQEENKKKVDKMCYVIANFGGELSLSFKDQIYEMMIRLIEKPFQDVHAQMCGEEGLTVFPYLTLRHEDQKFKKPQPQKFSNVLKRYLQRMKHELKLLYFVKS